MSQTPCGDEVLSRGSVFEWFNDLKTGVGIFSIIQETSVLKHLEMQTQQQMSLKWWHEIVDGLSEWWPMD
jgi:hypothetical protein